MPATTAETLLVTPVPRRARRRWLPPVLWALTVLALVDAIVGQRGLAETLRARRTFAEAQARLTAVQRENDALRHRARQLASDRRTIEALARTEMGYIRPGEVLFIITPGETAAGPITTRPTDAVPNARPAPERRPRPRHPTAAAHADAAVEAPVR